MKHAYLIIAHNEFEVLKRLVDALDDMRNDVFIHFDRKVKRPPHIKTKFAGLHILTNRIDVRWADVSMVEAEFLLFETAFAKGGYDYYHLLSGVDLPIKSQNQIHRFFAENAGKEFIGFFQGDISEEIARRVQYIHLFARYFREKKGVANIGRRILRALFLRFQTIFGIKRNQHKEFKKGTQWISATNDFVKYLLSKKESVLEMYHNTFCCDEIFVQTLCWNSPFRSKLFDASNEGRGCMRYIGWKNNDLPPFTIADFDAIMQSEALFARKFSSRHLDVVEKIINVIDGRN